jgi:hypothetical protein
VGAAARVRLSSVGSTSTLAMSAPAEIHDVDYLADGPHISLAEDAERGHSWTSITARFDSHITVKLGAVTR